MANNNNAIGDSLRVLHKILTGLLRAVGATSRRMDAKNSEILGHSME